MKNKSRTQNSIYNVFFNILYQVVVVFGGFILRSIFIRQLSVDYLGLNGLFSNILSILSLTELGMGGAIIYSMYKPIENNDEVKLAALTQYYKKMYRILGFIIFGIGLCITPFLSFIIKGDEQIKYTYLYFMLYLLSSVSSYFLIYKTSIVTASQKDYELKKIVIFCNISRLILQVLALLYLKSYFWYLSIQLIMVVLQNYLCSRKAEKLYPFINNKEELEEKDKKNIWSNIKSMFLYHIGGISLNNTDNIIISIFLGTVVVGFYSNYLLITTSLATFTSLIFTSITASLGNYNLNSSEEDKYKMFKILNMISHWLYGFCSICLVVLFQDFISLWIGAEYLLDFSVIIIIGLNFYVSGILYPIYCFRTTTNLFKEAKYIMLAAAAVNIILSVILGKIFGLAGILGATTLSRLFTNLWYEPYLLHKNYFKTSVIKYYLKMIVDIIFVILVWLFILKIISLINIENLFILFITKLVVTVLITNIIFYLLYFKTEEFKVLKNKLLKK